MTAHKHFKQLVRARMAKTGESYSTARRQLLRQAASSGQSKPAPYPFAGSVPAAAVLRGLLAHAGVRNPVTKAPFSEAMVFGIAGGIGAGMFAFHYAKENFSSFYVAGRHLWQDHLAWAAGALKRLGIEPEVKESAGVKRAEQQLRELLGGGRPVMAWVEGYRVVAIHEIDDGAGIALVGDGGDEPIRVPLSHLAALRGRIKSYRNRLLALNPAPTIPDLATLVRGGIAACVAGLTKARMKNFTLESFATWADRLNGSKAADSWEKIFPTGPLLYLGLRSITEHIEFSGTGGGLCRPIFGEFLEEAGEALGDGAGEGGGLVRLSRRYGELGARWSALAEAALPDSVPAFRETKALLAKRAELHDESGGAAMPEIGRCDKAMEEFKVRMKQKFPLDSGESAALRRKLQAMVRELYQEEKAARAELAVTG